MQKQFQSDPGKVFFMKLRNFSNEYVCVRVCVFFLCVNTHTCIIYNSEAFNYTSKFYRFPHLVQAFKDPNLDRLPALQASVLKLAITVSQQVMQHK
jgi:hypothetical protein